MNFFSESPDSFDFNEVDLAMLSHYQKALINEMLYNTKDQVVMNMLLCEIRNVEAFIKEQNRIIIQKDFTV